MIDNLRELPIIKRIELLEDLWDSIAEDQNALTLTKEQRDELDRRLDAYSNDGIMGRPAHGIITDIRKRL